jgi:hypothetical protein
VCVKYLTAFCDAFMLSTTLDRKLADIVRRYRKSLAHPSNARRLCNVL